MKVLDRLRCDGKNRVCASIATYNDKECLQNALNSLREFPLVIVTDGKWKMFNDPKARMDGLSYDGTRELVKSYPNTVLYDVGNQSEEAHINLALKLCSVYGYDYLLQIASDEYIIGDYDKFQDNCERISRLISDKNSFLVNFRAIHITPADQKRYKAVQRLQRNTMFLRLRDIHWIYYYCNEREIIYEKDFAHFTIPGITIYHDDSPRHAKRERQMKKYQDYNVPRERKLGDKLEIEIINKRYPEITYELLRKELPDKRITVKSDYSGRNYFVIDDISSQTIDLLYSKYGMHCWKNSEGTCIRPFKWYA